MLPSGDIKRTSLREGNKVKLFSIWSIQFWLRLTHDVSTIGSPMIHGFHLEVASMKRQFGQFILVALLSALIFGSVPAFSQDVGFYAGFNFGQSKVDDFCNGFASCDDEDTALSIFGGYQVNRNFGVEVGYTDLGQASISGPGGSVRFEATGFEFSGVGTIPLTQQFSLYGKLGLFLWDADARGTVLGFPFSGSDDGTDLTFAFGARFNFTKNLVGQLQWQRYQDVADFDVDVIGLGLLFRF
jgi:OOP family OmpA-OmpF porin